MEIKQCARVRPCEAVCRKSLDFRHVLITESQGASESTACGHTESSFRWPHQRRSFQSTKRVVVGVKSFLRAAHSPAKTSHRILVLGRGFGTSYPLLPRRQTHRRRQVCIFSSHVFVARWKSSRFVKRVLIKMVCSSWLSPIWLNDGQRATTAEKLCVTHGDVKKSSLIGYVSGASVTLTSLPGGTNTSSHM